MKTKTQGIYLIFITADDKTYRYVGQSVNIEKRWYEHVRNLKKGSHDNRILQRLFNKYGKDNFDMIILEEISDRADLNARELYYIERYETQATAGTGCNLTDPFTSYLFGTNTPVTTKASEGERQKMWESRGCFTEEEKKAWKQARQSETAAARYLKIKERKLNCPEYQAQVRASRKAGWKKMSATLKEKRAEGWSPPQLSKESRAKVGAAQIGRKKSQEEIEKAKATIRFNREQEWNALSDVELIVLFDDYKQLIRLKKKHKGTALASYFYRYCIERLGEEHAYMFKKKRRQPEQP